MSKPRVYVLDVRTPQEYVDGHIAGAHLLNWLEPDTFKKEAVKINKDQTILIYCRSGGRSLQAAKFLTSQGYKVINLSGGILAWESANLPVVE